MQIDIGEVVIGAVQSGEGRWTSETGKGGKGKGRKRKSFRAVGFCRYTGLNGLATSGWQPARVQIPAHTNMASGPRTYTTEVGTVPDDKWSVSGDSRIPLSSCSTSTHRLSSPTLSANSPPSELPFRGLNRRFFYFTGPTGCIGVDEWFRKRMFLCRRKRIHWNCTKQYWRYLTRIFKIWGNVSFGESPRISTSWSCQIVL